MGPTPAKANWRELRRGGADNQRRTHQGDQLTFRQLSAATENLARADRELAEHVRRVRLDNAEAILEAKNERTASLYLDGLLDTDEHRRLDDIRARAELDHQHARREVDQLHLVVRLLGTQASEDIGR